MEAAWNGYEDVVNVLLKTKDINVMKRDNVSLSIERLS